MNVYVKSPTVDGSKTRDDFLQIIKENHVALMVWEKEDRRGEMFDKMTCGDIVIIAHGANRNKKCFYAGVVDNKEVEINGVKQVKHLSNFIDLTNTTIPFSKDCS